MQVVTSREGGLFPRPAEIEMSCSCPDWAGMCKHVAAVLYGVGTRLDEQPELLFNLRQVDHLELIAEAGNSLGDTTAGLSAGETTIAAGDLADVFGIEIDGTTLVHDEAVATVTADSKSTVRNIRVAVRPAKGKKPPRPVARPAEKTSPEAPAKAPRSKLRIRPLKTTPATKPRPNRGKEIGSGRKRPVAKN